MSAAPGPSRPSVTTPLLASPNHRPGNTRDPSTLRYNSLPSLDRLPAKRRRTPHVQYVPLLLISPILLFVLFVAWDVSSYGNCYFRPLCRVLGEGSESSKDVWWRNSGPYAPWKSLGPGGGRAGLPRGCEIDQVNVLHRHTARYPTTDGGKRLLGSLAKLRDRKTHLARRHSELAFLASADFDLKGWQLDGLMDQGRKAAWRSGVEYKARYGKLLREGDGIFTRSAGGDRVVETGKYWLEGFNGNKFRVRPVADLPAIDVVIPEEDAGNSTLSVHNCPAYEGASPNPGSLETASVLSMLDNALERLNHLLKPQPLLDYQDLSALAEMCAYDSQAKGMDFLAWSDWCHIFDSDEWDILGYAKEVGRWYQVGGGSQYGATMGHGWIRELLGRLTDSAPQAGPTINSTLDDDPDTFPPGGQRLFMDFTHDNEMIEIIAAMKILTQHAPLPTDKVQDKRSYILSEIIPFGAQVVVERIACDLGNWEPDPNPEKGRKDGKKDYVRIFVNNKIHKVDHVDCKQSGLVEHGMCEVELFVSSQSFAIEEVDWEICILDDKNNR